MAIDCPQAEMTEPFPVRNATQPFWRQDLHELDNHRTTDELPSSADIAIIGAGYAGASTAYHLLEKLKTSSEKHSIVILEAREACSGATGRNGVSNPFYPAYRLMLKLKQ